MMLQSPTVSIIRAPQSARQVNPPLCSDLHRRSQPNGALTSIFARAENRREPLEKHEKSLETVETGSDEPTFINYIPHKNLR